MNRAVAPTDDQRSSVAAATTTCAATSASSSAYSSAQPAPTETTSRKNEASRKRAAGKRKRSRAQMTTASVRDTMDDSDSLGFSTSPKRARPSLLENHHQTHSDEDEDAIRFSVPPPPPAQPVPAELLCRYPNKPCPQERATKKHGELHSYCAYHRFKAQQYQRKLEQKKRVRRQREQHSPSALLAATTLNNNATNSTDALLLRGLALEPGVTMYHHSSPPKSLSPPGRRQGIRARTRSSPPRPSGAMYAGFRNPESGRIQNSGHPHASVPQEGTTTTATLEPFHHPVSLQEGDLQLLQVFLWDSESPPKTDSSGARSTTRAPRATSSPRGSRGSDTYDVSLDGFTFTSESL